MSTRRTKTKRTAKPKGKAPRASRSTVPGYSTFVNSSAGLAATGLRVGFPANRTVNLTYADYFAFSGSVGSMGQYQFRLNSAYDPNYTGAGHQPMGFDQWSLFYNHYVVEKCDYEVMMVTSILSNMLTHLSDDATVPASVTQLTELGAASTLWNVNTPAHIFKGTVDMAKFFNRSNIATDADLRATIASNPTEECFLTLSVSSTDGSSTTAAVAQVKLNMRVRFMEPKDLAPSTYTEFAPAATRTPRAPPTGLSRAAAPSGDDEYEFVRVKRVV